MILYGGSDELIKGIGERGGKEREGVGEYLESRHIQVIAGIR